MLVCIYNNLRESGKTFDHAKRIIIVMTYTFKMIGDRGQADFVRIFNKLYDSVKDGLNMSQIPIKLAELQQMCPGITSDFLTKFRKKILDKVHHKTIRIIRQNACSVCSK